VGGWGGGRWGYYIDMAVDLETEAIGSGVGSAIQEL
jgi:hypothetical protein